MPSFKTLDDLSDIRGKRVLVRVDLNVPVKDGMGRILSWLAKVAPNIARIIRDERRSAAVFACALI
ncbi:hypothetical protein AB9F35_36810, partial [Rhizobium leguminosarum]